MRLPRSRSSLTRLRTGAVVAFAAAAFSGFGAAAPAHAHAPGADLSINVPDSKITVTSSTHTFQFTVDNLGPGTATNVKLKIGVASNGGTVDIALPGGPDCTGDSGSVACALANVPNGDHGQSPPITVTPHSGAGSGDVATLKLTVTSASDPEDSNNTQTVTVALVGDQARSADLAVSATSATGHVGDVVTVKVTGTNNGPTDEPYAIGVITAPSGTEIVGDSLGCIVATPGKVLKCGGTLGAGASITDEVKFKITSATIGNDGTAEISGTLSDPKSDNNKAAIAISVPAASPTPAPPPVVGNLPVTGVKVGVIGGLGLAVVLVGGLLYVMARRRRVVLVTPGDETSE
jgi:Domain of unknown function DUF11